MREDWAEKLRRKLEGHRKTPPPGLWEGICKEMGFESEPVSKPAVMKRLYWAAAAAVLALVGFFVIYNSNDIEQPQLANAVSQQSVSETPKKSEEKSEGQVRDSGIAMNQATCPPDFADEPEQTLSSVEEELPIVHESNEEETIKKEQQEDQDERPLLPERDYTSDFLDKPNGNTRRLPLTSHTHKWSMGVNASGGLLAANTFQRTDRLYMNHYYAMNNGKKGDDGSYYDKVEEGNLGTNKNDNVENGNYSSLILAYTMAEFRSEHHLPIRFGVSLNYQLTPRIALHSGISYTYLYSEFSIPLYEEANYDQKLHYLGIPLGVSWQLWSTDHFQFYVSGGAMLEKCVNAEVDGNSVSKKPWQWSVDAAAGAEYSLIPQLGFYLEPSLGYYFDDGTALEHYYKKHPVTPTIEFGLRLHLNK